MTRKAKLALGICGALVAGVVITLLVAPEETKKVTNRIKKSAGKWVDQLGNVFSRAAEQHVGDLKKAAAEHVGDLKQRARQVKDMI